MLAAVQPSVAPCVSNISIPTKDTTMPRTLRTAALSLPALLWSGGALALTVPTPEEAKGAVVRMFGDPTMAKAMASGRVVIGTCKKTSKPTHDGEVACTIAIKMGAGSSETQANFYRAGGQWIATPTEEALPFPDPALHAS